MFYCIINNDNNGIILSWPRKKSLSRFSPFLQKSLIIRRKLRLFQSTLMITSFTCSYPDKNLSLIVNATINLRFVSNVYALSYRYVLYASFNILQNFLPIIMIAYYRNQQEYANRWFPCFEPKRLWNKNSHLLEMKAFQTQSR